jgi:glutathione S-transferase
MPLTFYHVNWCPECALVREKLDALGLSYQNVVVPDFRPFRKQVFEISGQYFVPVLKDGDTVLTETGEILAYLEEHYPERGEKGLAPPSAAVPVPGATSGNVEMGGMCSISERGENSAKTGKEETG